MGYIFEELIRKFSEMSNETAGEHFTPREVIRLMVSMLFTPDMGRICEPEFMAKLYDPARGEDVIIVTRGKNAGFNRVLKLPQSHKTTNWCAA